MSLPVPNAQEVGRFKALYEARFCVKLSSAEALELTTKAVQLYYVKYHALLHLRSEKLGE